MRNHSGKSIILFTETFLSVVLSFAVMLVTKVVFGTIMAVEFILDKSHVFSFFSFKRVSYIYIGIMSVVIILLISAQIRVTEFTSFFVILMIFFLSGLAILTRLAEMALNSPKTLSEIQIRIRNFRIEKWFSERMKNPMDIVWIRPIITLSILVLPAFIGILVPSLYSAFTVLIYAAVFSVGFNAINAFEHTNSHNCFFKNRNLRGGDKFFFRVVESYCVYFLNFMFARIPNWYRVQHIIIHHVENNGEQDTQSTLHYDRSSFIDFSRCAFRFAMSGFFCIDILTYLVERNRKKAIRDLMFGVVFFYLLLFLLCFWNWKFVVTLITFRFIGQIFSTLGFLQEHGMVDVTDPQNIYCNSLHFITSENMHASLGDDAHIEHHLHQGSHWSKYITDYNVNENNYEKERALGFKDSPGGLSKYFYFLWRKDFKNLAKMFVIYGRPDAPVEEVATLLVERSRPYIPLYRSKIVNRIDDVLGWSASYLLPCWQKNKP